MLSRCSSRLYIMFKSPLLPLLHHKFPSRLKKSWKGARKENVMKNQRNKGNMTECFTAHVRMHVMIISRQPSVRGKVRNFRSTFECVSTHVFCFISGRQRATNTPKACHVHCEVFSCSCVTLTPEVTPSSAALPEEALAVRAGRAAPLDDLGETQLFSDKFCHLGWVKEAWSDNNLCKTHGNRGCSEGKLCSTAGRTFCSWANLALPDEPFSK